MERPNARVSARARAGLLVCSALAFAPDRASADPVAAPVTTPPLAYGPPSNPLGPVVVAAIGDSLTDARSQGGKFLELLRERCPESRFDNFGKGGQMVSQMRARFAAEIFAPGRPAYTHVIVFGGVNDLYSDVTAGRTRGKIERDLAQMYDAAHGHGAKVVAVTVAPWGGFRRYFNAARSAATLDVNRWIFAQREATKVDAVVDAYGLLSCGDPTVLCPRYYAAHKDGLHFGLDGHRRLFEALFDQVFAGCS